MKILIIKLAANKMRRFQKKYDSAVSPPPARNRCWASTDARNRNKAKKPLIHISDYFLDYLANYQFVNNFYGK